MTEVRKHHWALFAALMLLLMTLVFPIKAFAVQNPLDEIQEYTITVDMRSDGTMDISYHLDWKVLDDSSEGPLSWVKIGIPNKNVDEIQAHTSNIKKIEYNKDDGKTYVYVYFDRDYYANEIISFDFSIHQSNMYVIDQEDHMLRYSFTPGWFDEIEVKSITIKWNKSNVLKSTALGDTMDGYLIWTDSLSFGEKLNASVYYNLDAFEATEEGQVQEEDDGISAFGILVIIIVVIVIILLIIALIDDDYDSHSGFGGGSRTYVYTGGRSSCACARSCACACACAGGGRAGCSKKDFYHTNVQVDILTKVLEED